ncbi:hypothetical protein CY34DRAFT_813580, partial [Suillus luteus UH-Slu-Lm8-n1]
MTTARQEGTIGGISVKMRLDCARLNHCNWYLATIAAEIQEGMSKEWGQGPRTEE